MVKRNWGKVLRKEKSNNKFLNYENWDIHTPFTFLKCTTQWFLAYSQICAIITIINFEHSHHPKRNFILINSHSFPLLSSHWQSLIYFVFLGTCLFWTFHMSRILEYVALRVWLLSISILFLRLNCVVVWIKLHSVLRLNNPL